MECIVVRKIYICIYMCEVIYIWYSLYYVFDKEKNWSLMLIVKKNNDNGMGIIVFKFCE